MKRKSNALCSQLDTVHRALDPVWLGEAGNPPFSLLPCFLLAIKLLIKRFT